MRVDLDRLRAIAAERRAERDAAEAAAVEAAPVVEAADVSHLDPIDGVWTKTGERTIVVLVQP